MKLNWRSALRDLNVVLLTLLLVPVVLIVWWQAVGCWQVKAFSPGCLIDSKAPAYFAAPKARGSR